MILVELGKRTFEGEFTASDLQALARSWFA